MANNRGFIVGSIFGGIIATIVVGNVLSHLREKNMAYNEKGCDTYVIKDNWTRTCWNWSCCCKLYYFLGG